MPALAADPFPSRRHALRLAALLALAPAVLAAQAPREERVQFKKGATSATIEATLKGSQTVDYLVGASAGQTMNVSMATKNTAAYFNILEPGEKEVAIFNGSVNGNQYEGTLAKSGDYRVRVYLMRSAARRNEAAPYRLEIIVSGAVKPVATRDAKVAGTNFHATGAVPCTVGGKAGSCPFGVTRRGGGSGDVVVTRPDGRTRTITFERGTAVRYDQSQADKGAFKATRAGDASVVQIGDERYEIPDAVIQGG